MVHSRTRTCSRVASKTAPPDGCTSEPANANRYAYAGGDPLNNLDPTGTDLACAGGIVTEIGLGVVAIGTVLTAPVTLGGSLLVGGSLLGVVGGGLLASSTCS